MGNNIRISFYELLTILNTEIQLRLWKFEQTEDKDFFRGVVNFY